LRISGFQFGLCSAYLETGNRKLETRLETTMKFRTLFALLLTVCLFHLTLLADNPTSPAKQAGATQKQSQAAVKANTAAGAKAASGSGFDTSAPKPAPAVKATPTQKPSMVGKPATDWHPTPKISKPLDKTNVPAPGK
jgi:hypothetical protein